jgi:hypothetical protein
MVLAAIGLVTYFLSKKLNEDDYETAHAREEVVRTQEEPSTSSSQS